MRQNNNGGIVFLSYITIWLIVLIATPVQEVDNISYWFVGGLMLLLISRATFLKKWWDR